MILGGRSFAPLLVGGTIPAKPTFIEIAYARCDVRDAMCAAWILGMTPTA